MTSVYALSSNDKGTEPHQRWYYGRLGRKAAENTHNLEQHQNS